MTSMTHWRQLTDDELKDKLRFAAVGGPSAADAFWSAFPYLASLTEGNERLARSSAIDLLKACRRVDRVAFERIHKGTVYYWLGYASCLLEDYEGAVFFFDASASEDIKIGRTPTSDPAPAMHFLALDGQAPDQFAKPLVEAAEARVNEFIRYYNDLSGKPAKSATIDMSHIRDHFLRPALDPLHPKWRPIATAFITYCLEWDYRNSLFDLVVNEWAIEPFCLHLFKGCLLFESLLKANELHPLDLKDNTLSKALGRLSTECSFPNPTDISATDFRQVLTHMLMKLGTQDLSVIDVIEVTGKARNTLGHNLGWTAQIDKYEYHHLTRMIAAACLHAMNVLY